MTPTFDLLLRNGTVVNQDGIGRADIGVIGGRIARIGDLGHADAAEIIDCTGLHILPGVIDSQVHFREPGNEHKEDLETGSRAAVMGGVTSVFEMPNTSPLTTEFDKLADKVARGRGRMHSDFAFWFGATVDNVDALAEAIDALLRDPQRRADLGARGKQRIEENFCWRVCAEQMTAYYRQVLAHENG